MSRKLTEESTTDDLIQPFQIDGAAVRGHLVRLGAAAAEMLGYCMLGPQGFTEANDLSLTEATEARLEAALEAGDSHDARLVLLALHAGIIQAQVVDRYQLETD